MLSSAIRTARFTRSRGFATAVESSFKVAAIDAGQPSSAVTVLVKAGSRYETKPGVAHVLKNFAFKNTSKRSSLRTVREAELYGGVLSAELGREHLAITAEFLRGDEDFFVELLSGLFTSPAFAAHELHEAVLPSVEAESAAAVADSVTHAIEVAHSLAFRSGLGYSLFAPPHSEFTPEDVKSFASKAFSSNNMAIVGTGIEESKLVKLVERHFASIAPSAMISSSASRYFGGDSRSNAHSHSPAAVFVGYGTTKASPELAVLAAHLNPTPSIKWSAGNSPLAPLSAAGASVHVVNAPFSDAALFGLVIQAPSPEGLTSASKAAVKALKDAGSGSLKGDDLTRAIARAKYWAAKSLEHRNTITNALGSQLLAGSAPSLESVTAALDKITPSSVAKAVGDLQKSKPTFVAVGDVNSLPYADELGL